MSKYLIASILGFIFGLALCSFFKFNLTIAAGSIILLSLIFYFFRADFWVKLISLAGIFLILGLTYAHFYQKFSAKDTISSFLGQELTIFGYIADEPDVRGDQINLTVLIKKIEVNNETKDAFGRVLVVAPRYPEYEFGQKLKIKGKLTEPKIYDEFNYKNYLANQDIYSIIYQPKIEDWTEEVKMNWREKISYWVKKPLFAFKKIFLTKINQILPEPQSSYLAGLILGAKRSLPENLKQAFINTNTIHIVVVSGYNISIIVGVFLVLTRRWSKKIAYSLAGLGIIAFVIMTGAEAPAIRAALMAGVLILAQRLGRMADATIALLLSAVIILFFNPFSLRFDLGFQLSFLATAGLIYLAPILEEKIERGRLTKMPEIIKEPLIATLSAQVLVIPLILVNFHRLSLIAPVANVLILPLIPLAMGLGFGATVLGFLWLPLGQIVGWFVWLILSYQIWVVENLAKIPAASITVDQFVWIWLIPYYLILAWLIYWWNKRKLNLPAGRQELRMKK